MIDGRLVPAGDVARVAVDDGLVRGDGAFEGMRLYGRRPRTPDLHLDRLQRTADAIGLALDRPVLEAELAAFCEATANPDCGVRLIVTRGGQRVWREEAIIPEEPAGIRLLPVASPDHAAAGGGEDALVRRQHGGGPPRPGGRLSRRPAGGRRRRAGPRGADLVTRAGSRAGPWSSRRSSSASSTRSPAASRRRRCPVRERRAGLAELAAAEGALVLSTVQEARPVAEIRGVAAYDAAAPGVLAAAAAVREAIAAAVA